MNGDALKSLPVNLKKRNLNNVKVMPTKKQKTNESCPSICKVPLSSTTVSKCPPQCSSVSKDLQEDDKNQQKVLAKVKGFPYWPAHIVSEDTTKEETFVVKFQDGTIGLKAAILPFTKENAVDCLKKEKVKYLKSKSSKYKFTIECAKWGLIMD